MNQSKIIERFGELIGRGNDYCLGYYGALKKARMIAGGRIIDPPTKSQSTQWGASSLHLLEKTFGKSTHYNMFYNATASTPETLIQIRLGILKSAKEDIEKGFLYDIKHLAATELFDSVLEQGKYFLETGYKDAAAIYCRIVIEEKLKDICASNKITLTGKEKASIINDTLQTKGVFVKQFWRAVQHYLDIGNDAAHGKFGNYKDADVKTMIEFIEKELLPFEKI